MEGPIDMTQNTFHHLKMTDCWLVHELADSIHSVGKIWPCHGQVLECTNNATVLSLIWIWVVVPSYHR